MIVESTNVQNMHQSPAFAKHMLPAAFTMYLNEDANGMIYVSKTPMNQKFYCTPARLKCVETKSKNITRKGVFAGAICETIDGRILKVVKVKNRKGYGRSYIREGSL